jgi:hypothetical protein
MEYFAGVDWGEGKHAVCVIDKDGNPVSRFEVKHDADGLEEMVNGLSDFSGDEPLRVAIERPTGLLVDTLAMAGFAIIPVHPNQVKAARPRYGAAQSKDDRRDAYILADFLRTDGHRMNELTAQSDELKALRTAVHHRLDLLRTRLAKTNELVALLNTFWPGPARLFSKIESPISLAFLTKYPTPESASKMNEARMAAFLKRQSYSGNQSAEQLVEKLRQAPAGQCGPHESKARGNAVQRVVRILAAVVREIASVDREINDLLKKHPDAKIFQSLPASGTNSAAQVLVEIGDRRDHFTSFSQLSSEFGVVPVTIESGKYRGVRLRRACNKNARRAITLYADNSRHESEWAAKIYDAARKRGHRHTKAIRILARAWLRVIWRLWQDHAEYDVTKHGGAAALGTAA